jgi:hypothetical protein
MKLTVIIPSRGRATKLVGAIHALSSLESGDNEVTYGVVCDKDDEETCATVKILQGRFRLAYLIQDRAPSLGGMVNKMAEYMPADVYLSLTDDALCMTKDWDKFISDAATENPNGVWWWESADPDKPMLLAIVSENWRRAAGRIFTDYFPFWYDDIWLLTLWILAAEAPMLTLPIKILDCPAHTHRMRDLRFWHNFYLKTQPLRVKAAKDIAAKLGFEQSTKFGELMGVKGLSITKQLSERLSATPPEFESKMEEIEQSQGETSKEPTPEYVAAKQRAETLLKQIEFLDAVMPTVNQFHQMMAGDRAWA